MSKKGKLKYFEIAEVAKAWKMLSAFGEKLQNLLSKLLGGLVAKILPYPYSGMSIKTVLSLGKM